MVATWLLATFIKFATHRIPIKMAPKKRKKPGPTSYKFPKDRLHDSIATHKQKMSRQNVKIISNAFFETIDCDFLSAILDEILTK